MKHTSQCTMQYRLDKWRGFVWKRQWPGHCPLCLGEGGFDYPGTWWEPPDYDVCECLEAARCPRCGHQHHEEWNYHFAQPCEACGWTQKTNDYPFPDDGPCQCEIDDLMTEPLTDHARTSLQHSVQSGIRLRPAIVASGTGKAAPPAQEG